MTKERRTHRWGLGSRAWHASWSSGGCLATEGNPDGWDCWVWTWSSVTSFASLMMDAELSTFLQPSVCHKMSARAIFRWYSVMMCVSLTQIIAICSRFSRKMFAFHTEISRSWAWSERLDKCHELWRHKWAILISCPLWPSQVSQITAQDEYCHQSIFHSHRKQSFRGNFKNKSCTFTKFGARLIVNM